MTQCNNNSSMSVISNICFNRTLIISYQNGKLVNKIYIDQMENLLNSRLNRDEEPAKFETASPEKFGKAGFAGLTYTPSRLADNPLFKEATTLKKVEEPSSKYRESEALNNFMKDRLKQLQEERDGIEQSLTQQILMYKKMLNEMEFKHQQRIKEIQKGFNDEMAKIMADKDEEARFAQSQKELLQNRIWELEGIIANLKDELSGTGNNLEQRNKEFEKLEIHYNNLKEKFEEAEKKNKQAADKAKAQFEELSRKLYNTEVQAKSKLEKLAMEKQKERQNMERFHRTQLQKVEQKRQHEAMIKNQELKDLATTFQAEANRLNEIINSKDRAIDNLNQCLSQEKQKILDLTRNYTCELSSMAHQKGRLKQELQGAICDNGKLREDLTASSRDILNLQAYIDKLKDQLELHAVNLVREKDRNGFVAQDLHRQIARLSLQNERIASISGQNNILCKEVRNLKELLLESSLQMQKCKEEFIRMGRQKDHLIIKLREMGIQNETLHRIKLEREQQARGWRDTYYMARR